MNIIVKNIIEKDVVVIGGGTSGVFAAISSSDAGASTLLVEKTSMLGGTMTNGGVNFPGLFYAWGKKIIGGHAWETIEEIMKDGLSEYPKIQYYREDHWNEQFLINKFATECIFDKKCKEFGVEVMLHTSLAEIKEGNNDCEVLLCAKEGLILVKTKCVIDATGDANAIKMAGYNVLKSENLQPATLICNIDGYNIEDIDFSILEQKFNEGLENNLLPEWVTYTGVKYMLSIKHIDIHIPCEINADTSKGKTLMEQKARASIEKLLHFIRTLKGCGHAVVVSTATECGIRETNRIEGEYIITVDDYIEGKVFEDAICYAYYPIDLHTKDGVSPKYLKEGRIPTIPLRSIIPKNSSRIIAVGRCLSSDTLANSALRVQVPCMAMGQAGGIVAGLASLNNCKITELKFNDIKSELLRQKCIVPN